MAQSSEPVVRDSAGLPIKTPGQGAASPLPFAEIAVEEESDLQIFLGEPRTEHRAFRKLRRRVRRQAAMDESDHPDRWLISYSDFITLLFAFFVVMYAISQVNESKYRVLSESLIQAFRPQGTLEAKGIVENKMGQPSTTPVPAGVIPHAMPNPEIPKQPALPKLRDVELELKKELDPLIQSGDMRILSGTQGLSIEMSAKVSFKTGEAAMTFDSFLPLRNVARILARNAHTIHVEGHAALNEATNTQLFATPWELSAARASKVVRYFIDNGVDPQRLSATGYGDTRSGQAGAGENRRVSIIVLPMGNDSAAHADTLSVGNPSEVGTGVNKATDRVAPAGTVSPQGQPAN